MELNVASWNIYIFGDKNAEGIAKTIEENQIDVIGIQEAGIYFDEDEKYDIVKEIAEKVGYHYEFVNALDFRKVDSDREHKMGNAIISRFPIENLESFSLNPESIEYDGNPEKEPRIAIKCEFEIEGRKIVFITTHLQYTNEFEASDIRKAEIKKTPEDN